MSRNEMIQCFLGAKIIQTLVLQALANTSHSWQRSRVFRPKFLVNILRFGSKKNLSTSINQKPTFLSWQDFLGTLDGWILCKTARGTMASGFGGNRDAGAVLHSNGKICTFRRDPAHLKIPQTPTSSRFECLNVERLKESRFVAWKPQHFGKVLPCMDLNMEIHEGLTKTHPLGKHHWGVLPVTPVLLDFILISACLSLQEPGFYTYWTYCILLLHLLATLKYRRNMWNVVCFFVILPTAPKP